MCPKMRRSLIVEQFMKDYFVTGLNDDLIQDFDLSDRYLNRNSAISWEFLEENRAIRKSAGKFTSKSDVQSVSEEEGMRIFSDLPECINENIPVEYFLKYEGKIMEDDVRKLFLNKNVPQWFIERHLHKITKRDTIPNSVFRDSRFSYEFLHKLISLKRPNEFGLLLLCDKTPLEVVQELSTSDNLSFLVQGPFATQENFETFYQEILPIIEATAYYAQYMAQQDLRDMLLNPLLPITFMVDHFEEMYANDAIEIEDFFYNPRFMVEHIEKMRPFLREEDRLSFLVNPNLTVAYVEEFYPKENEDKILFFYYTAQNHGLPWQFFDRHANELKKLLTEDDDDDGDGDNEARISEIKDALGNHPNCPIAFYRKHPEFIVLSTAENKFTYQFLLEEEQTEEQLTYGAAVALQDGKNLPGLVLGVLQQEAARLEHRNWYR